MPKKNFYSYNDCKAILRENNIGSLKEYKNFKNTSNDELLPSDPSRHYKPVWSRQDFFGVPNSYTYCECKHIVERNGLKDLKEYSEFKKSSKDVRLPKYPAYEFREDWNADDFFNKKNYYTYIECKEIAHRNNISNNIEYAEFKRKTKDEKLPLTPRNRYRGEFEYGDFYNIETIYSYQECKTLVRNSKIKTLKHYTEFRKKQNDKKLPINLSLHYKSQWNADDFFGKPIMYSYEECKSVVLKNGLNSYTKYEEFRKTSNDKRLPSSPKKVYQEKWDEHEFYGTYLSLEAFREFILSAGISKKSEYEEQLKQSVSALPKNPVNHYGFKSFKELIQFDYFNLEEICEYIKKHKIRNSENYVRHAKTNPYLRAHPNKIKGFVGKLHYYNPTQLDDLLERQSSYKLYINVAKQLSIKGSNIVKRTTLYRRFIEHLSKNKVSSKPHEYLHEKSKIVDLDDFINGLAESEKNANTVRTIVDFIDALLLEYCADIDSDSGEVIYLPGFRNPYIKHQLATDYNPRKTQETTKNILPFAYIVSGRRTLCPNSATSFGELIKSIEIFSCDFFEVAKSKIDNTDPNCVWRTREVYRNSGRVTQTIYEMWSPVRTIAMLTLLELPLRGQQILWNDSGEADSELPIINSKNEIEWIKNTHHLAGEFKEPQGFIKRYEDSLGFYCTTNKTKAREGGYSVPYMPEELARWLITLRDWQIKYNPIKKSVKWSNHFIPSMVDENRLKYRGYKGRQCFLFRSPMAKSDVLRAQPLKTAILKNALPILLFNIQELDVPLAKWIGTGEPTNTPTHYISQFTPHSLRASIITAYIVDHKLNPALVAKLVGHANVVMTIYYAKVTEPAMRRELEDAEKRAFNGKAEQVQNMLINNKFENLIPVFVDNSNGAFLKSLTNQFDVGAVVYFDYGFCPVGGQSCDEGGDLVAEKSSYRHAVPTSAVLGRRNCVQCRFFVTGFSYMPGLKALADILAHKTAEAEVEMSKYQQLVDNLMDERDECESQSKSFVKRSELNKVQGAYETATSEFIALTADLVRVYRLADACAKSLINQQSETENIPMVINRDDVISVEAHEVSIFEQVDNVCKNAELFAVGNPKHAIMERTRALDILLNHNEISSNLFTFSQNEQLKIGNHLTTMLVQKLGGWGKLDAVMEGRNKLRDFLEFDEVKKITRTISNLNEPIHLQSIENKRNLI